MVNTATVETKDIGPVLFERSKRAKRVSISIKPFKDQYRKVRSLKMKGPDEYFYGLFVRSQIQRYWEKPKRTLFVEIYGFLGLVIPVGGFWMMTHWLVFSPQPGDDGTWIFLLIPAVGLSLFGSFVFHIVGILIAKPYPANSTN